MLKFIRIRHILFTLLLGMIPLTSFGFVSITIAPPELPVYEQPPCPGDGYIWTPGYWVYGDDSYYWVPGVWVEPPRVGVLWTPGYWGFVGSDYRWNAGYWGPHVGFYGGVNYGFGYGGVGFGGGEWQGNVYRYNTAVTNVNTTVVRNTYVNNTVVNNTTAGNNRASFNGTGGVTAQPTAEEQKALQEQHIAATTAQRNHEQTALHDRNQSAAVNHGHPTTTALSSVKGQEQVKRNANEINTGQPKGVESPKLEKRRTKSNQGEHPNNPANEGNLKPEERTKANVHETNHADENATNPNTHHAKGPSGGHEETAKPRDQKSASKPHGEKRPNDKSEKNKE
jgi:WXXGXW repeat (2 copies)